MAQQRPKCRLGRQVGGGWGGKGCRQAEPLSKGRRGEACSEKGSGSSGAQCEGVGWRGQ